MQSPADAQMLVNIDMLYTISRYLLKFIYVSFHIFVVQHFHLFTYFPAISIFLQFKLNKNKSPNFTYLMLQHFQMISETAANMMSSLHHCLTLFHQQEDVRILQLKEEKEKCRVLEESLNVLAKEHHQLEQSVASHLSDRGGDAIKRFLESHDDDEYHDAYNNAEGKLKMPFLSILNFDML